MPSLRMIEGPQAGRRYELKPRYTVLGRNPDCCDIVLERGAVSRLHARIELTDDACYIEDPGSHNGTIVNSEVLERGPLGRRQLQDSDQIEICGFRFVFEEAASSESSVLLTRDEAGASPHITSEVDISGSSTALGVEENPAVKLHLLLGIIEDSAGVTDLKSLLSKVLDRLFGIFRQAERGFVMVRDEADGLLGTQFAKRRDGLREPIRFSRTLVDKVINEKTAILSKDAASDEQVPLSESIIQLRLRSIMCVPLLDRDGGSLGVIELDVLERASEFTKDDLDVLAGVARHLAIVIENARLNEIALRQQQVQHEMERLRRELTLARKIQQMFLPSSPPPVAGFEFFNFYEPAAQVGGDYYDYVLLPRDRLAVVVADVAGKGVGASLLMARLAAETRFHLVSEPSPVQAVEQLNNSFVDILKARGFITFVLAVFEVRDHQVAIINAGHWPPLLRRDGRVELLEDREPHFPLGYDRDCSYHLHTLKLQQGDCLAMFTDGVIDATNDRNERYGVERLCEKLASVPGGAAELGSKVLADLHGFVGNHPQVDDMCILCVSRTDA